MTQIVRPRLAAEHPGETDSGLRRDIGGILAGVAPVVQAGASDADRDRCFAPGVLEVLYDQSLFRLLLPEWLGGDDLGLPEALAGFEAAARIDGSFGWAVSLGSAAGLLARSFEREAAEEIFGPRDAAVAGSLMVGPASLSGEGFQVSGHWSFASGSQFATWFTANCMIGSGRATVAYAGQQDLHTVAFPRQRVEIIDTWDVLGMRATSSHDFTVQDEFVPARYSFNQALPARERSLIQAIPYLVTAGLAIAAIPLGVARHAIDEFVEFAATKQVGRNTLRDLSVTRIRLAEAEVALRSARALLNREVRDAWESVSAGGTLDSHRQALLAACMVHAAEGAARAIDMLFPLAGMAPLYAGSALGRCWRDVHTIRQHALLSPRRLEGAGIGLSAS